MYGEDERQPACRDTHPVKSLDCITEPHDMVRDASEPILSPPNHVFSEGIKPSCVRAVDFGDRYVLF